MEKTHSTQDAGVVDNFEADISTENVFYPFLAVLVTQPSDSNEPADFEKENTIKRICKSDMNKPIQNDVSIEHYSDPKETVNNETGLASKRSCSNVYFLYSGERDGHTFHKQYDKN